MLNSEERLVELMERAVKLLTILVTKGLPKDGFSQREQVMLLSSAGMQPKEIADLLGTTPNTVSVTLAKARAKATED